MPNIHSVDGVDRIGRRKCSAYFLYYDNKESMIKLRNITKVFQQDAHHSGALNNVSPHVPAGRFMASQPPAPVKVRLSAALTYLERPTDRCSVQVGGAAAPTTLSESER